ncbi:MAG: hypothetical protein GY842_08350 [bacterium]|nr:hypothetical protein [bacterium]
MLAGWVLAGLAAPLSIAAEERPPAVPPPAPQSYWPSDELVETLLTRWARAATQAYELTDTQHQQLRAQLLRRWPRFLHDHQEDLQPVLTEYLQARLTGRAPTPEAAASLAHRALAPLAGFRQCLDESSLEFCHMLTDRQRALFEADRTKLTERIDSLSEELHKWEAGAYDPKQWARLTPADPPAVPSTQAAEPTIATPFEQEMSAWQRYVAEFIERYALDDGQRRSAHSILEEMRRRATTHFQTRRLRIAAMEELIHHPEFAASADVIDSQLAELYGPIDRMFEELNRRLHKIPTAAQTRAASATSP